MANGETDDLLRELIEAVRDLGSRLDVINSSVEEVSEGIMRADASGHIHNIEAMLSEYLQQQQGM